MLFRQRASSSLAAGVVLTCAFAASGCNNGNGATAPGSTSLYVVGAQGNFRSINTAMNAAPEGETIDVQAGTYGERVIVTKRGMKLRGTSAVLDGALLDGRGIGIHVNGAPDVEVTGFTVRNFERGIVIENAANTTLRANEVHSNNSKDGSTAPPLAAGVSLFEGVVLIGATNAQITDNVLRNNGHDGLMIMGASRNNTVRGNRVRDNGAQTTPGQFG